MLRSIQRAVPRTSTLNSSLLPRSFRDPKAPIAAWALEQKGPTIRSATTHAISNPTLSGIEKRWETMAPQEQADLWMALRDRMKNDWHELTLQERKAAYWIAFGPHGPRKQRGKGEMGFILRWTTVACVLAAALFFSIRSFARPPPKTMNEQWQKMTNDYLKEQNVEPITGISSEGYKGKGMVQSKPLKGGIPKDEDED